MVSKVQERIYAETAATLLGADWILEEIPEPLDFEIRTPIETFGLEVRQIFVDTEARYGSPSKRNEANKRRTVSDLAKRYYESGGAPISAKFLGTLSPANFDSTLACIIAGAPRYPGPSKRIETLGVKVFLTPLPESFANYSRWALVTDKVGWVKRASATDLQHAITRKATNLALYLRKYDSIDLLLVADRTFNSGKLAPASQVALRNPGFRNIYFMSFPEAIHRVG